MKVALDACVNVQLLVPAQNNTFSGSPLDRAGARRSDPSWISALLADVSTRAIGVTADGVLVEAGDAEPRLARLPLAAFERPIGEPLLLGIEPEGGALFAVDAGDLAPPPGVSA